MRTLRSLFAAVILGAVTLVPVGSANANHEGPYVVGEKKDLTDIPYAFCYDAETAVTILELAAFSFDYALYAFRLARAAGDCDHFYGVVTVVGQTGEDVIGEDGVANRVVHVRDGNRDLYVFTEGDNTKVIPAP